MTPTPNLRDPQYKEHVMIISQILWSRARLCWSQALRNASSSSSSSRWGGEPDNLSYTNHWRAAAHTFTGFHCRKIVKQNDLYQENYCKTLTQINKFCFLWNLWDAKRYFLLSVGVCINIPQVASGMSSSWPIICQEVEDHHLLK